MSANITDPSGKGLVPEGVRSDAAAAFAHARHDAHRADFDAAIVALRALDQAPPNRLASAYEALVGRLMGHDPRTKAALARSGIEALPRDEQTMIEAIVAIAVRDLSRAADHLELFTHERPEDPYGWHARGFNEIDRGNVEEGIDILERLVGREPGFVPALNHLSYGYAKAGRMDDAIAAGRLFVERDPTNPSALDSLADVLVAVGDTAGAIACLERAVELAPMFAYGWYHLASLHEGRGNVEAAHLAYSTAVARSALYGPAMVQEMHEACVRIEALRR